MASNLLEDRKRQNNDFIQELSDRSLWNILEEIYSNLTLTSVEIFKSVSPEWRKIICQFEESKIPRIQLMEDHKITQAWKTEIPTKIVKSSLKLPFSAFNLTILADERHIVFYELIPKLRTVFILDAKKFEVIDQVVLPKQDHFISMQMNSDFLVALVQTIDSSRSAISASLLLWNRSGKITQSLCYKLPWIDYYSLLDQYILSSDNILKRVVRKVGNNLELEVWDLKKKTMVGIKKFHFKNEIKSYLASPFNDKSCDLLIVHNFKHHSHQTFCRYSERGELLWKIEENSFWCPDFPLTNFNSKFLTFAPKEKTLKNPATKLIFANMSDGKVHKVLTMPEQLVRHIHFVELQGSQVAIQVVCLDKSADVYIYDWRSGVMLTKVSQFLEKPVIKEGLNCFRNFNVDMHFTFQRKKITIITGGYLYSASFEPDLQKTWNNHGLVNKIAEELVLDMQLNDPVSLKTSTNKNMPFDRIEKSES
jgi:hypothetical protein